MLEIKRGGFSPGYTVRDRAGREWSVKLYPEARTEVVASRILWAVGYHQAPLYALEQWTAEGATGPNPQAVARFREARPDLHGLKAEDPWAYDDNPFVGTQPLNGLLVLQVMLGNSDLKPDQNRVYMLERPHEGARRWYVASDLGHTFGRTGVIAAPRDDVEVFEQTPFIRGVEQGVVHSTTAACIGRSSPGSRWPTCSGSAAGWRQSATGSGTMPSAPAATRRRPRNATSAACNRRSPKAWRSAAEDAPPGGAPPSVLKLCGARFGRGVGAKDTT